MPFLSFSDNLHQDPYISVENFEIAHKICKLRFGVQIPSEWVKLSECDSAFIVVKQLN